jgi:hypothetical protein
LQLEAAGNGLMGEQTWPTEEELMMAGGAQEDEAPADRSAGRDRRTLDEQAQLPKGMSSYQADWFMDEDGQLDFNAERAQKGAAGGADGYGDGSSIGDDLGDDLQTLGGNTLSGKKSVATAGHNSRGVAYTLKERQELDEAFPDEMDTPDDISARQRFARYRALQSFRSSPWHPKENLPQDYARIFQFENFAGTQRRLLAESKAAEQAQQQAALHARREARAAAGGGTSVCGASVAPKGKVPKAGAAPGNVDADMAVEEVDEEGDGSGDEGSDMEEGSQAGSSVSGDGEGEGEEDGMDQQDPGQQSEQQAGGLLVPGTEDFVQTGTLHAWCAVGILLC